MQIRPNSVCKIKVPGILRVRYLYGLWLYPSKKTWKLSISVAFEYNAAVDRVKMYHYEIDYITQQYQI